MDQVKVGGETPAYCTSCRDMRHHVVVAMVGRDPARVECLSCHKQHNYKAAPPGSKGGKKKTEGTTSATAKKLRQKPPADSGPPAEHPLDALLAVRSTAEARAYSPSDRYAVGDLLNHPSFGLGAVSATPAPGKIEVIFRDSCKLLMHERPSGGSVTAPPKLQPPPRREDSPSMGASDAPPKR